MSGPTQTHQNSRSIGQRLMCINYWYVLAIAVATIFGWNAFQDWRISQMDYDAAAKAYEEGDFDTAFQVFQRLAEEGDAAGQLALGITYSRGDGTEQSLSTAVEWLLKSAEQGEVHAMTRLADTLYNIYDSPRSGRPGDLASVVHWYGQAAEAGNSYAQRRFGLALIKGEGVDVDRDTGLVWIMRAIESGNDDAMVSLGHVYEVGLLGEKDQLSALHWYLQAARRGQLYGAKRALILLEDEQSPAYDLEQAYFWALVGRRWWRDHLEEGSFFRSKVLMISRIEPPFERPPDHAQVNMGLMDEEAYQERLRIYEEARSRPETWPFRMDAERRLRAEAAASAVIARWPESPTDGEEIDY